MTNENSFEQSNEVERTKEEAQAELIEKFGLRKTLDFQSALQQGQIELAASWLEYIINNQEKFPQYQATWDSWLSDRQQELKMYQKLQSAGLLEKMEQHSKEEAQAELIEKFGLRKTSDFQTALRQGQIELAASWLEYIQKNKMRFPQYLMTWDSWLSDRQQELLTAQEKQK